MVIIKRNTIFICMLWVLGFCNIAIYSAQAAPLTFFGEDLSNVPGNKLYFIDAIDAIPNSLNAQDRFLSHLAEGVKTEGFEDMTPALTADFANADFSDDNPTPEIKENPEAPETYRLDFKEAGTATLKGGRGVYRYTNIPSEYSGVFGSTYSAFSLGRGGANFDLEFETAQTAFGFFAHDVEIAPIRLTFETPYGQSFTVDVDYTKNEGRAPNSSVFFFGMIDTENPFTKVSLVSQSTWDGFAFDDITIATREQMVMSSTPEPTTLSLLVSGLLGLIFVYRGRSGGSETA